MIVHNISKDINRHDEELHEKYMEVVLEPMEPVENDKKFHQ